MTADIIPAYREAGWELDQKKEKTEVFVIHLSKVFKFNPRKIILEEENELLADDITSAILHTLIKLFTIKKQRI